MRMLRLHQGGKARFLQGGSGTVLVNPEQIQTVISCDEDGIGAYVYLIGEEDALLVNETIEYIENMIKLS